MDLRIDANGAWPAAEALARLDALAPYRISCVEQPVAHGELAALAELRRQARVPVMLDESLTSLADAQAAIAAGACDLFNIRLSKCGGFLASLRLAAAAHGARLGYQLGCHPGESGILSADRWHSQEFAQAWLAIGNLTPPPRSERPEPPRPAPVREA